MAIFTYALNTPMPSPCVGSVLTIGNFDGVHVGHQSLLTEADRQAQAAGVPCVAVTFDPHPIQLLRPERLEPFLTTLDDRASLLLQHGATHVLILQTSFELLQLTPREFFDRIVVQQAKARALVEGFNFAFGKGRAGTVEVLRSFCAESGVAFTLVSPREIGGQRVSSSRVRTELLAGNVDAACTLLGRPYRLAGIVGTGQKRGATLGFPTANLHQIATLVPGNGVYAVRAIMSDGVTRPGAANVGPNPTFGENARKVEVHLLDFTGDLYDRSLSVEFVAKIRDTKPFAGVQALTEQIQKDVGEARRILGTR
jgi:riboflavin kinase/FMN adenylyltransferase